MSFLILLLNNSPCKQRRQPSANTPHPNPLPGGEGVFNSPRPLGEGLGVRAQVEVSHD